MAETIRDIAGWSATVSRDHGADDAAVVRAMRYVRRCVHGDFWSGGVVGACFDFDAAGRPVDALERYSHLSISVSRDGRV